ncbi:MAG: class I SAM-dependent methyltransferase [bacterium]|nr:class I SAM-dependent methyltransferase [bacterium]
MKLDYIHEFNSQNIDIKRLRPNKSYDYLIENRNSTLKELFNDEEKLAKFLIKRDCPVCDSLNFHQIKVKDKMNIVGCDDCSVIYVNPIFNEQKYLDIYKSEDYQEIVRQLGEESHNYRLQRFGSERVDIIDSFHNEKLPKNMLDIGCSTGFVIETAKNRGWETTGIELNPSAANFGKNRGLNIIEQEVESINFQELFSDICLFDVLEHLTNPKHIIKRVHDLLYEGGVVYIYVPNWNSASRELLGIENSHFIWPSHHLTYFTPITLKNFLENNGFKVIHWETQGLDLYDWEWNQNHESENEFTLDNLDKLQFYINASGHGKNLRMYAKKY